LPFKAKYTAKIDNPITSTPKGEPAKGTS